MNTNQELYNQLLNRHKAVSKEISTITKKVKELNKIPGHLCIKDKGNYCEYYHQSTPGNKHRKYISKSNYELACNLANKSYYNDALKRLSYEEEMLSNMINMYDTYSIDNLIDTYKPPRQKLISKIVITDEEYAQMWQNQTYAGKPFSPDDKSTYYTNKKERVRSKSEINIANLLKDKNIPYKYECPIYLNKSIYYNPIYPDFTILNKRTRKIYYLEHLGKMNDAKYISDNIPRLLNYERNGIILGDKLLLTYETSEDALDLRIVENLINTFFI